MARRALRRIFYVEDEPDIQEIARLALESIGGFDVEIAGSGEEAIGRAAEFRPDLIMLDVMMPGMDGPATLEALRRDAALATVPVVFMTAKVQPREVDHYMALGAASVIAKPFDPLALPDRLRAIWEQIDG